MDMVRHGRVMNCVRCARLLGVVVRCDAAAVDDGGALRGGTGEQPVGEGDLRQCRADLDAGPEALVVTADAFLPRDAQERVHGALVPAQQQQRSGRGCEHSTHTAGDDSCR